MEQKIKFIIIGLIAILIISLFINFQTFIAKQDLERQNTTLKKENVSFSKEVEETRSDSQRLNDKINLLKTDLDKAYQEKDDLQKKFDLISKEREQLIDKLKARQEAAALAQAPSATTPASDAYWAGILKAKTELEMELANIRSDLKTAQINNEQLQREKSSLALEVSSLTRERDDLNRQIDYNKKVMDSVGEELVREKNDKFQIQDSLKSIKNENQVLRRQLKSLDNRKLSLERKSVELEKENTALNRKLNEMEMSLKDKMGEISNLKSKLGGLQGAEAAGEGGKESVELAPIVVRPQQTGMEREESPASAVSGQVLQVKEDGNFIIIDLGQEHGLKEGDLLKVYREDKPIAVIEVNTVRKSIAACDIKGQKAPIQIGDTVR